MFYFSYICHIPIQIKRFTDYLHNTKSRLQLLFVRVKKRDISEEIDETKSYLQSVQLGVRTAFEKVYYAPGFYDKTLVLVDYVKEHKPLMIATVLMITSLSG